MKKTIGGLLLLVIVIAASIGIYFAATGQTSGKDIPLEEKNVLVVYFSRTGTTEAAAMEIAKVTGGSIHRVIRDVPYPDNLEDCVEEASREMQNSDLPAINDIEGGTESYNVIFLCYPIWLNSMPMPMVSFMEENDLSGKYIIPVATHSGSEFGNSISVIKSHCGGSTVLDGIALRNGNQGLLEMLEEYGFSSQ